MLKKFRSDLVDNLHFDEIVPFLNKKNLLQQAGIEVVKRREVTDEGRLLYLLDMMINKDGWWKALMEFLENHNLAPLKFTLMEAMEKCN